MVSVKTDIEFVILAPGGREDLFSDVTVGVPCGCLFVFLIDRGCYLSLQFKSEEITSGSSATDYNPIKHHLQMVVDATG